MRLAPINQAQPVNWSHPLNQGKVAWYLYLPAISAGNSLIDITSGRAASFSGTPLWEGAFPYFEGHRSLRAASVSDYVNTPGLSFSGDFTFACWVYNLNAPHLNDDIMGQPGTSVFSFWNGTASFYIGNTMVVVGATTPDATWVHWVLTRSGTGYKFFMNGRQDGSGTGPAPTFTPTLLMNGYHTTGSTFRGYVNDASYWARGLSDAEAASLYAETLAGYPTMLNRLASPASLFPAPPPAGGLFPWYLDNSAMSGGLQTMGL